LNNTKASAIKNVKL